MSLMEAMRTALVGHLDLTGFVLTDEDTPVREVLNLMRRYDRTTTLVTRENRLAGIFTERDVLQKVIARPDTWGAPVREFMTPKPVAVPADATILAAVRLMNEGHFRDLPVLDADGRILGNLTDNSVVRHLCDHLQAEVLNLPPDPNQVPRTPEGA